MQADVSGQEWLPAMFGSDARWHTSGLLRFSSAACSFQVLHPRPDSPNKLSKNVNNAKVKIEN